MFNIPVRSLKDPETKKGEPFVGLAFRIQQFTLNSRRAHVSPEYITFTTRMNHAGVHDASFRSMLALLQHCFLIAYPIYDENTCENIKYFLQASFVLFRLI